MRKTVLILAAVCGLVCHNSARAQKFSISTDLLGYACLGTLNAEASYSVSRYWSITAGARYNPFIFRKGDAGRQFQLRQQSYTAGARLWPWHTLSGWWFEGKLRYQEFNMGGIFSRAAKEGDRFGTGLYAGYTYMLSRHFNLEFGAGVWTGYEIYRKYSCPACGVTTSSGRGWFVLPDDIKIAVVYVF